MISEFRSIDFWLCLVAAILMISVNVLRWRAMDPPDRLVRVGFTTLLAAACYGFGVTPNPETNVLRYLLFTAALLQLVISLAWMAWRQVRRRREDTHPH